MNLKGLLSVDLYSQNHQSATMKIFSDSIRNFCEGFISFYTVLYKEIKSW